MGIPSYFSHIIKKYEKTLRSLNNDDRFDNLFMDCNSIIYDALRKIESFENIEDELITITIKKIEDYIQEIKPSTIPKENLQELNNQIYTVIVDVYNAAGNYSTSIKTFNVRLLRVHCQGL